MLLGNIIILFYLFFPPTGILVPIYRRAPSPPPPGYGCAGAHPRSWWTQVGPTDRGTGGAGNRTRDLPPHGPTAYHLRHQGRIRVLRGVLTKINAIEATTSALFRRCTKHFSSTLWSLAFALRNFPSPPSVYSLNSLVSAGPRRRRRRAASDSGLCSLDAVCGLCFLDAVCGLGRRSVYPGCCVWPRAVACVP